MSVLDDRRLAGLSLTACSYALILVAMSDHEGRIYTGGKPLVAFVAGRRGATRGDRRLMEREFAELSRVGFLSDRGDHVQVIAHAPRAARESSTTAQRPRNEAPTCCDAVVARVEDQERDGGFDAWRRRSAWSGGAR